jgi:hypothetical protein
MWSLDFTSLRSRSEASAEISSNPSNGGSAPRLQTPRRSPRQAFGGQGESRSHSSKQTNKTKTNWRNSNSELSNRWGQVNPSTSKNCFGQVCLEGLQGSKMNMHTQQYSRPLSVIGWFCVTSIGWCTIAAAEPTIWRGSIDNGDKVGIGLEIVVGGKPDTASLWLLHPDHLDDFSAGRRVPTKILRWDSGDLILKVEWKAGQSEELIIRFQTELKGERVQASMSGTDPKEKPDEFELKRVANKRSPEKQSR